MDKLAAYRKLLLLKKKLLLRGLRKQGRTRTVRKYWVHPINRKRDNCGVYNTLVRELRLYPDRHTKYLRMDPDNFDFLLASITPLIQGEDTVIRKALEPGLKLAVTLHYLAEGISQRCISDHYRLGKSTVSEIIHQTCQAIRTLVKPRYLQPPSGPAEWRRIADGFKRWDFPNCLGAVDGKHITIQKPRNSGSAFHNYKGRESIVLMAVCDSEYRFTLCDVGCAGSQNDGGVWENSAFGKGLQHGTVNLPNEEPMGLPFVFVGDEAFPLRPYLMRPWPGRMLRDEKRKIYNYRLSRSRRVIENAFGILSSRWRLLYTRIVAEPDKAVALVETVCTLHNFLLKRQDRSYMPVGMTDSIQANGHLVDGFWRGSQVDVLGTSGHASRSSSTRAVTIREDLTKFFSSADGQVSWQWDHVRAT